MLVLKLLLIPLATWRLYRMLATDTGPKQVFRKLRIKLGVKYANKWTAKGLEPDYEHWATADGSLAEGITCCWCSSIWWSALLTPLALFAPDWLFLLLAMPLNAGSVCLLFENRIYSR